MTDSMSHRIVQFLGSLWPLYDMDHETGTYAARQLTTGARITPIDEPNFEEDQGMVLMHWPGAEPWMVEGRFLATEALVRYVDLHGYGLPGKQRRAELRRMSDHFAFKTGACTYLEWESETSEVFVLAGKVVRAAGKEVAMSIFKHALGLP